MLDPEEIRDAWQAEAELGMLDLTIVRADQFGAIMAAAQENDDLRSKEVVVAIDHLIHMDWTSSPHACVACRCSLAGPTPPPGFLLILPHRDGVRTNLNANGICDDCIGLPNEKLFEAGLRLHGDFRIVNPANFSAHPGRA
jgi:hypothetical protein